jgi:hypothetical protein
MTVGNAELTGLKPESLFYPARRVSPQKNEQWPGVGQQLSDPEH